jgi:poly(3-hydroxybutyrate) depolymerase
MLLPLHLQGVTQEELEDVRKVTFASAIDSSIQYYAVNPSSTPDTGRPQALFLSLHGASVEARGQAASYYPKTWGHIVSPTNRRPFGYNWEDWGRMDALEVLAAARKQLNIDPSRIYLTGHSMGGHGTWMLGGLYPDLFGAIAPSAGWISFWTYRDPGPNPDTTAVRAMLRRSTAASETFKLAENYKQLGVYVLHGIDDDNVPIEQARMMVDTLRNGQRDLTFFQQPKAGHWWDNNDEDGADCVDWPPLFDFFARHARPEKQRVRMVDFVTPNPGVSARDNWAVIEQQREQLKFSAVHLRCDPGKKRFVGVTENVARLTLDVDLLPPPRTVSALIDSQKIENISAGVGTQIHLERRNGAWRTAGELDPSLKGPRRNGTFKDAFRSDLLFVYGTKGSAEENAWAYDRARLDAEKFWYQGNGSIDVIADTEFAQHDGPDRSVILYGNERTNAVWPALLAGSPVTVRKSLVRIGERSLKGGGRCCFFVRPRPGSATASIAVVAGTDLEGMRLTYRIPYLSPGFGLPDVAVFSTDLLEHGETGIELLGYFGNDWSLESGEFLWNTGGE